MSVETPDNAQHYIKTGYRSNRGVGGSVTQQTNRTTAVTLNALTGQITTNNASLAAEAAADFTVNNSLIEADDIVVPCIKSGVVGAMTEVVVAGVAKGSFVLRVINGNPAAGAAETGAIVISFIVLKGQTT